MVSKNDIRKVRQLAQKKFRDELGLFVVEGEKMVAEALASDFEVESLWRTDEIGEQAMSRMTLLNSPSPALAILRQKPCRELPQLRGRLVLALDAVRDPGNLGTIMRIADWFGIGTILASRDTVDVYNPKVVQATMGAVFRVKVHYCDLAQTLGEAARDGIPVWGTFLEGENIYAAHLSKNGIIVMGSESFGISPQVESSVTGKIHIPRFTDGQTSESLNVAVATAITVSEFRRR